MQDQPKTIEQSELTEDLLCAAAYITILPAAVLLFVPAFARNQRVRFHACQSVLLNWFLILGVFVLGLTANVEQLLGTSHGAQIATTLIWSARILCMSVWALASVRIATGRSFRVPYIGALAENQANGRLFNWLAQTAGGTNVDRAAHAL